MTRAARAFGAVAALLGLLAVAGAALASHALAPRVDAAAFARVHLALAFQFGHALLLLAIATLARERASRWLVAAGACVAGGVVLFCGALYANGVLGASSAPAPFGGSLLMLGWLALAGHFLAERR
jgi:uncharacterized membrane protein YgdD (TMEM256/DUF423 family)